MENQDLIQLWKTFNEKLDTHLALSRQQAVDITRIKVQSLLYSMKPVKLFAILIGIVWVGFVDVLLLQLWPYASPFFLASATVQSILTTLAIGINVYQWVLIQGAAMDEPVLSAQQRIAGLTVSTLWVTRLLILQFPVWTTFYLSMDMIRQNSGLFWLVQVPVTLLFTITAIWLFVHIRYKNRHKKWFKMIFMGDEWTPLMKAMDLLDESDRLA